MSAERRLSGGEQQQQQQLKPPSSPSKQSPQSDERDATGHAALTRGRETVTDETRWSLFNRDPFHSARSICHRGKTSSATKSERMIDESQETADLTSLSIRLN